MYYAYLNLRGILLHEYYQIYDIQRDRDLTNLKFDNMGLDILIDTKIINLMVDLGKLFDLGQTYNNTGVSLAYELCIFDRLKTFRSFTKGKGETLSNLWHLFDSRIMFRLSYFVEGRFPK